MTRLILFAAAWCLFAQDNTIRVDVQQVLVPVVVTDKKGHHVSGLRASDFQIFEDGVPQQIAAFSSDAAGSVDDIAALSKPALASGPRRTFVICIDTLHISAANAGRTREALENFFEKEKTGDAQFVLVGIGRQMQILQSATTNPLAILVKLRSAAFQTTLGGLDASAMTAQLQSLRARMEEFCRRCACGTRTNRNCDSEIDNLKQSVDADAERWIAPTNGLLEQFKNVVAELAKLPTARTLILVSDGFNIDPRRELYRTVAAYLPNSPQFKLDEAKEVEPGLREALKIASERNVTIDAIDSRGGATASLASSGSMDASAPANRGNSVSMLGTNRSAGTPSRTDPLRTDVDRSNSLRSDESASMEELARSTGGTYFHDSKDMLKEFRAAFADGREYYVLAYVPKNSAHGGKFRAITIETTDKKLNIRAKSGYWAAQ